MIPSQWTVPMRHALVALQQRPVLRQILTYAEQRQVQLYVVGGALRDLCLGRSPHDVDLVLAADVMEFAGALAKQIGAAYVPLDPERGEVRVVYRKRDSFDFARLKGHGIDEDLSHRDFPINAMACPLATLLTQAEPELIDPYGGYRDLQERRIRMVSPTSFQDDPLRLLRAFRFAAALDCTVDAATLARMEPVAPRLGEVAVERIHYELFTLFSASRSSPQIVTIARLGLLDVLFPELAATHNPSLPAVEHHDLFGHAIDTYKAAEDLLNDPYADLPMIPEAIVTYLQSGERPALIKCAALMHAIGDPPSDRKMACRESSWTCSIFPDGAEQTALIWEGIGERLKLSRQRVDYVKLLLAHRHQPFALATLEAQGRLTLLLVHNWSKELGDDMLGVFALAIGDATACGRRDFPLHGPQALGQCLVNVWDLYQRRILPVLNAPRLVTGHDLRHIFHLTPGPQFKKLLDGLEVARVEGHVRTRTEALQWLERQLR